LKDTQYFKLLKKQIADIGKESRCLEFKSNYQDADRLGKYISALSNGACLDNKEFGYLYFGVKDETLELIGTTFDSSWIKAKGNQNLEIFLRQYITPRINFKIEEFFDTDGKRYVVFVIPAASGEPTCFQNIPYIRVDSSVTDLRPYTEWMRTIYNSQKDWSAELIPGATIDDLDPEAIRKAFEGYCQRNPEKAQEATTWSTTTFLDRAKITIDGQITRAAILLLGKEESAHYLDYISQIVWRLRTEKENAGDIFSTPFLLATSNLLGKIRNYRIKIFPNNSLIPAEVWKYDTKSILEGLHNCIAHQDYLRNERIVVTEEEDCLIFENAGSFYEGSFEDYIEGTKTPKRYRNRFLTQAMVNLKMIDTQGFGIHDMFVRQKERFLPMPDYDKRDPERVKLIMPGRVINEEYSLLLMEKTDLDLTTTVLLDRFQKGMSISKEAVDMLRKAKLIEGKKPNLYISKQIAKATHQEAEYTNMKGFDDQYYRDLIVKALHEHNKMKRVGFNRLLMSKLSSSLNDKQKGNKIDYLLKYLRKNGVIYVGKDRYWYLTENAEIP
jgi:ATP-dependent DNA helicase RecG